MTREQTLTETLTIFQEDKKRLLSDVNNRLSQKVVDFTALSEKRDIEAKLNQDFNDILEHYTG